tara:strand:- start:5682 stop:6404 length:723 start_codon:yes stop_codon:yes gene_type:complete
MAQRADIGVVYNTLKDLANKDQQGFISESEFNNFANIAQLNIFNGLFDELKDAKRLTRAGFNPMRDKSRIKRVEEDLSYFSTSDTKTKASGKFAKPDDMARLISISTFGSILLDQSTKKPVEICYDEEKIDRILISDLSAPNEDFPVALISDSIHVFPTSINKIQIRYYKYPESTIAGVRSSSLPTYSSTAQNKDFELPEHYTADLVYEIAKMVGLNLRDSDIVTYTGQEMATRKQAETF